MLVRCPGSLIRSQLFYVFDFLDVAFETEAEVDSFHRLVAVVVAQAELGDVDCDFADVGVDFREDYIALNLLAGEAKLVVRVFGLGVEIAALFVSQVAQAVEGEGIAPEIFLGVVVAPGLVVAAVDRFDGDHQRVELDFGIFVILDIDLEDR